MAGRRDGGGREGTLTLIKFLLASSTSDVTL